MGHVTEDTSSRITAAEVADFDGVFAPFRREMLAHCYRMLGSLHDAEDAVQEAYVRAWRSYGSFEGRSSARTWLYRIATNVCLTEADKRQRRALPKGLGQERSNPAAVLEENREIQWLEPIPDTWLPGTDDPAAAVTQRTSVRLALVAALQHLPPSQRAALLLKEVLQFKASEIADLLGSTTAAVNSSMQRARAHLEAIGLDEDSVNEPLSPHQRDVLEKYASALEQKDIDTIVTLFTSDAVWEMPPFTGWYQGPADIGILIGTQCPAGPGELAALPVGANGQPGFAVYIAEPGGGWTAFQFQVIDLTESAITHAYVFFDHSLFTAAGLPLSFSDTDLQRHRDLQTEGPTR